MYRVPRKMDFVKGHSFCPSCRHQLGALDLIPLFSYIFLGGKCRYCKKKIGARDTLIELFGGAAALFCGWYFKGKPAAGLTVFLFFCILTVVTFMDMDTMEIEDGCWIAVYILAAAACFYNAGNISYLKAYRNCLCKRPHASS
ncbi:prepilin peptidase, partial [Blautia producta]|nr:prepilin peptidase [Blautia producta]